MRKRLPDDLDDIQEGDEVVFVYDNNGNWRDENPNSAGRVEARGTVQDLIDRPNTTVVCVNVDGTPLKIKPESGTVEIFDASSPQRKEIGRLVREGVEAA